MEVTVLHGPDRVPLRPGAGGRLSGSDDTIPFHGVVSGGLRGWLEQRAGGAALWERCAHRLHDGTEADNYELRALRAAARRQDVLSLTESAEAARRYADAHLTAVACNLWNTKEGHTSSVWVVTPDDEGDRAFVLNVGRDTASSEELRETSERLRTLVARDPALPIAAVLDVATVELDGARAVTVTRNELVRGALEVHRPAGGSPRYALVERFLTHPDAPARISAIRGRAASQAEAATIDAAVDRVLGAAGPDVPIGLDINDGDVVFSGREAIVVAIA